MIRLDDFAFIFVLETESLILDDFLLFFFLSLFAH